ncbi:MAG: UTP--glucose-1-phosphate uridylyltransferase [Clostridiales bacterium]|nr:UTP--glucose-1-phosphate uridylyltransferase [Clostridiales bacterium]
MDYKMQKVRKAVIPVAGYGTRFLPFTKAVPKPMLPILNKPALQIIAEEVVNSGITDILFIVGYKKEILESHFEKAEELESMLESKGKLDFLKEVQYPTNMANIKCVIQEVQNGTASAVALAEEFVNGEPFAVLFGDDVMYNAERPVTGQLIDVYEKYGKTVLGCKRVGFDAVTKYAAVEFDKVLEDDVYNMVKVTEKPKKEEAKSDLAPLGRYVCSPDIFNIIRDLKAGANGEYQFTDALDIEASKNGALAYVFKGTRYDMGDRLGYLKANIEYGLRDEELGDKLKEYLKELI